MLALSAATVGLLVATVRDTADVKLLTASLGLGQVLGHVVLGTVGHAHAVVAGASGPMLVAHVAAVVAAAVLIAVGGHLCACVSHVLRANATRTRQPASWSLPVIVDGADQPLRSALLLAASMSHRGPPVSLAR